MSRWSSPPYREKNTHLSYITLPTLICTNHKTASQILGNIRQAHFIILSYTEYPSCLDFTYVYRHSDMLGLEQWSEAVAVLCITLELPSIEYIPCFFSVFLAHFVEPLSRKTRSGEIYAALFEAQKSQVKINHDLSAYYPWIICTLRNSPLLDLPAVSESNIM